MFIDIVSLNVRGLGDALKCRIIFNYYRSRAKILCLQETHSTKDCERIWANEWGGNILFSHGTSQAQGVCILLDSKIPYKIIAQKSNDEGRMIACQLQSTDDPTKGVTICNIYGPNKDRPEFFTSIFNKTADMSAEIVYIGDFNLVLDPAKDKTGTLSSHPNSVTTIKEVIDDLLFTEVWRVRNPDTKTFSWMRAKPQYMASRIDFAMVTQGLANIVNKCMYLLRIKSDHLAYYISMQLVPSQRGVGYWKINNTLLRDPEYLQHMNVFIDEKLREAYGLPLSMKWIFLKREIADFTIKYAKARASESVLAISQLSEIVLNMEYKIANTYSQEAWKLLNNSKADLKQLLAEKNRGVMFHAKCRWYEEGEQNTKYFCNLEKRHYASKLFNKILVHGVLIDEMSKILKEQEDFYRELYTLNPNVHFDW